MSTSLFGTPRPFPESGLVAETHYWTFAQPPDELPLVSGDRLGPITVAYQTYGFLNEAGDNGVLICHSLTGDCHAAGRMPGRDTVGWWDPLIGPGRTLDTNKVFVVCASVLGGCGGSTGPASVNPKTGRPYGSAFPKVTMRDVVNVHAALLDHLGVNQVAAVSGPSMGGSQAWEFAVAYPDRVRHCIPVAASPFASAALIAWDAVSRQAIFMDPDWQGGDYYGTGRQPESGLSLARQIASITYYSPYYMDSWFGAAPSEGHESEIPPSRFGIEDWLEGEGRKLVSRFDTNAYLNALYALDTMDISRPFGSREAAFRAIKARLLAIGVSSDLLFPPEEVHGAVEAARYEKVDAQYAEIDSNDGHDACLLEIDKVGALIQDFLRDDPSFQ